MSDITTKLAIIKGIHYYEKEPGVFTGEITFRKNEHGVYYGWKLSSDDGKFLGFKTQNVHKNVIPQNIDVFEFALNHAIEGLKKYRVGRKRV